MAQYSMVQVEAANMKQTLWVTIIFSLYITMIASYGNEIMAGTITTSFLFLLALNPYWAGHLSGVVNLRNNKILYATIILLPFIYSLWKFFNIQEANNFEVVTLWDDGVASISLNNLVLYCTSNILFSAVFVALYIYSSHRRFLGKKY